MVAVLLGAGIIVFLIIIVISFVYRLARIPKQDILTATKTRYWTDLDKIILTDKQTHADLVRYVVTQVFNAKIEAINGAFDIASKAKKQEDAVTELHRSLSAMQNAYQLFTRKEHNDDQEGNF